MHSRTLQGRQWGSTHWIYLWDILVDILILIYCMVSQGYISGKWKTIKWIVKSMSYHEQLKSISKEPYHMPLFLDLTINSDSDSDSDSDRILFNINKYWDRYIRLQNKHGGKSKIDHKPDMGNMHVGRPLLRSCLTAYIAATLGGEHMAKSVKHSDDH